MEPLNLHVLYNRRPTIWHMRLVQHCESPRPNGCGELANWRRGSPLGTGGQEAEVSAPLLRYEEMIVALIEGFSWG